MEVETTRLERICDFVVGLTVIVTSYAAALLAMQYFVTRLC
jgi:hypothetical protein